MKRKWICRRMKSFVLKYYSQSLQEGSCTISEYKDINIELSYCNTFQSIHIANYCAKWKFPPLLFP
jgi:hypothetical protein